MADMELQFTEAEQQQLQHDLRQRKAGTEIGYSASRLRKLQEKTHNIYYDRRMLSPWPSLSKWALDKNNGVSALTKKRVTKFVHEALGSLIFLWFVIFSVWVKVDVNQNTGGGIELLSIQSLYTAFIQAFGLGLALVASGFWSGDYNSTYTLVTALFPTPKDSDGEVSGMSGRVTTAFIKIIGQHLGAFIGALLALVVLGNDDFPGGSTLAAAYGIPGVPGNPLGFGFGFTPVFEPTVLQAFLFEMLGSMMLGLLMMIIQFNPPNSLTKYPQLSLPFTLLALVTFGCPITGAAFNWTRYFGHAIVALIAGGTFGALWWLYLLAPLAGHFLAAALFLFVYAL